MKALVNSLTGLSLLTLSKLVCAQTSTDFNDSFFNKPIAASADSSRDSATGSGAGSESGSGSGAKSKWTGQIVAQFGVATSEHETAGFNRSSTGLSDEMLELKISRDWQLAPDVKAVTGVAIDTRHYINQSPSPLIGKDQYETTETDFAPGETYIEWNLNSSFWLRHGYYVVSYGMSDAFALMDKLAPRDNSRWGQEVTSKTRKPFWLSEANWHSDGLEVNLVVTHKFKGDHIGLPGNDYDAFIQYREAGYVDEPHDPKNFKPEWVLNAHKNFRSGDWEILVGEIYNKSAVIKFDHFDQIDGLIFSPEYSRTQIAGAGVDYVTGALVWKAEAVWLKHYLIPRADFFPNFNPVSPPPSVADSALYQTLIGVDYTAPWSLIASFEMRQSKVVDFDSSFTGKKIQNEYSVQLMKRWLNDRLYSQLRFLSLPDDAGRFYQLAFDYDLTDAWKLSAKYTDYVGTDPNNYFERFTNSDRFLAGITFQF